MINLGCTKNQQKKALWGIVEWPFTVILCFGSYLALQAEIRTEAQNDKQLNASYTPQKLKEPKKKTQKNNERPSSQSSNLILI